MKQRKTHFVSDLHLFANRSSAPRIHDAIERALRCSDTFVLGGDIFDFRWSRYRSHEETIEQSLHWLKGLVAINPECRIHYLLGNHDANPSFISALQALTSDYPQLVHHPHILRLGNTTFLHGDIIDAKIPFSVDFHELLDERRAAEELRSRPPGFQHSLYDVAVRTRVHRLVANLANSNTKVLGRVSQYLSWAGHGPESGTRNVYFGHTHRSMEKVTYDGMQFSNPGAAIQGIDFRIIEVDLDQDRASPERP
jgi:UDP-2,3-diacylglucosamine hydrolase